MPKTCLWKALKIRELAALDFASGVGAPSSSCRVGNGPRTENAVRRTNRLAFFGGLGYTE